MIDNDRGIQIVVGVCSAIAAIASVFVGSHYISTANSVLSAFWIAAVFCLLIAFFGTVAYRLLSGRRRNDGGLLPRWSILSGALCFSVYYLALAFDWKDATSLQVILAALGVPAFAWVGVRTFMARGRNGNET